MQRGLTFTIVHYIHLWVTVNITQTLLNPIFYFIH